MRFAFTDDQLAFADAVRDLLGQAVHARRGARGVGVATTAACPACGRSSPRWASSGCSHPSRPAAWGCPSRPGAHPRRGRPRRADRAARPTSPPSSCPTIRDHARAPTPRLICIGSVAGDATVGVGLAPDGPSVTPSSADAFLLEADDGLHLVEPRRRRARRRSRRSTARAGWPGAVDADAPRPCCTSGGRRGRAAGA